MTYTKHEQAIRNKGAREAITRIIAHVKLKKVHCTQFLLEWLLEIDERYQKKSGGLGRSKKSAK